MLYIQTSDQETRQEAQDSEGKDSCLGVIANQIVLDSFEEYFFICEKCLYLPAALLENLGDDLCS